MNDGEQKKRKRAVQIIVRVTPEEKAEILKNMESVGIFYSDGTRRNQ